MKIKPNHFLVWDLLGYTYSNNFGNYNRAIAAYEQAIKLKPDYLLAIVEEDNTFYDLQR
ncbi:MULTISPECIES: hypothetical protein [Nostocales]|uniref:Tetratricopeptide repeat protein n=3 Tax=Nostocales TaxID=1161 RepID=A0A8S9TAZ9_9CYAN|nr:hypothetical protein [Tolypothrix bouteillei]KAF3889741.1 hypothetical protein DA73_0400032925 [Tolypothrix bouteillei VB521301]